MRDDRERLLDILEAIERIEKHAQGGRTVFEREELVQIWILHHLQIIGEAARSLDSHVRDRCPEIPWTKIIGMRHILVHHYFEIDTGDRVVRRRARPADPEAADPGSS